MVAPEVFMPLRGPYPHTIRRPIPYATLHWRATCLSTGMAKAIAGFFRTQTEGEQATLALYRAGFSREEVNFLAGNALGPAWRNINTGSSLGIEIAFITSIRCTENLATFELARGFMA